MKRIAIFASGKGSNFQAIMDAVKGGVLHAEVGLLVCDNPTATVINRAEKERVPTFVFQAKDYQGKGEYEREIGAFLRSYGIEWMILAGYMRLIGPTLLNLYPGRIINIHPSLLPAFPGKDAIQQALAAGVKNSGITIHYVDEGMDSGPIIAQKSIIIEADETEQSLQQRIQEIEHEYYPSIIQKLLQA